MSFEPSQQDPAGPPAPPPIDAEIEAAARLAGIDLDEDERALMEPNVRWALQRFERRRQAGLPPNELQPATVFAPAAEWTRLPRHGSWHEAVLPVPDPGEAGPLPEADEAIAYAPAWKQAAWLRQGGLTSVRLTEIALERIARLDSKLLACITVMGDSALRQAAKADEMLARGEDLGPLHGLPWGAKDLFDTEGVPTTYGAAPYRDRVPTRNAAVVQLLEEAGAVLVAKTSLGALAMGDVWFGGRTRNPWNLEQGSSGSSAGSCAGVAAGLFSFALGTETLGSIVSPSVRCGVTGLRPSFGRVSRGGAMALCWSLDKVGPIARCTRDTRMVLRVIRHSVDDRDASYRELPFLQRDRGGSDDRPLAGLRVGYRPEWLEGPRVSPRVKPAFDKLIQLGAVAVVVDLPDGPHDALRTILDVEAAAAFEELTRSGRDDELTRQDRGSWPNTFRSAWMVPAVELLQADRYRRRVAEELEAALEQANCDVVFSPPFAGGMLLLTNFTGHPCLTLPVASGEARTSITLWGRFAEELELCRVGEALEDALGLPDVHPELD